MEENELLKLKIILEKIILKLKYAEFKYLEEKDLLTAFKALITQKGNRHKDIKVNPVFYPSPNQIALRKSFKKQDFYKAYELIENKKTELGPIEKAILEIALDSQKANSVGFSPKNITPNVNPDKLHVMKEYGLVLGINAISTDGTPSQFAHIGPTYKLMNSAVKNYSVQNPSSSYFKSITSAFEFSNNAANFYYSSSKNEKVGELISNRIKEGKVTTIPISCRGHAMGLSVVPDTHADSKRGYLVFTNRGEGADPKNHGTQIYKINDLTKINPDFIKNMVNGHFKGTSYNEIMSKIEEITESQPPIQTIKQKSQKNDNCTIANTRANIHGIMLCQKAIEKNKSIEDLSLSEYNAVKNDYKQFTGHMHKEKINMLANALQNDPKNFDLIILAKKYIEQHPNSKSEHKKILQTALHSIEAQKNSVSQVFFPTDNYFNVVPQKIDSLSPASPSNKQNKKNNPKIK